MAQAGNMQQRRTIQEMTTTLTPREVVIAAKTFFARRNGIYAAFVEREGPTYVNLRGQGGEEIAIGTATDGNVTRVTGSTYLFDQQIARFLSMLPTPAEQATGETGGSASTPPVSTA
ncbi:MAG TPA: hypothetical protein VM939_06325 [Gemmatimonadaceae bacterium]|nr:hypothetical protein [Gemmatimonadaceae bacterium]